MTTKPISRRAAINCEDGLIGATAERLDVVPGCQRVRCWRVFVAGTRKSGTAGGSPVRPAWSCIEGLYVPDEVEGLWVDVCVAGSQWYRATLLGKPDCAVRHLNLEVDAIPATGRLARRSTLCWAASAVAGVGMSPSESMGRSRNVDEAGHDARSMSFPSLHLRRPKYINVQTRFPEESLHTQDSAPVAQWIEQRFPKPRAQVRFLSGACRPRSCLVVPGAARTGQNRANCSELARIVCAKRRSGAGCETAVFDALSHDNESRQRRDSRLQQSPAASVTMTPYRGYSLAAT